jgi:hypothetical protein
LKIMLRMGEISEASSLSTIDGLVDGLISFSFCMLCLCISDFNSWVIHGSLSFLLHTLCGMYLLILASSHPLCGMCLLILASMSSFV